MHRFPNIQAADSACVIVVVVLTLLALIETTLSTDKPNDATVKTASHVVESKNSSTHPPANNPLPPCVPVEEDKHPNKNLNKNKNTNHDDYHGKGNRKLYGKNSKFHTHDDTDDYDDDHLGGSHPAGADRKGKFWLVPPFLIGASSIVIAYVAIHCLYTHCNCDDGRNAGGHRSNNAYPAKTTTVRRVHLATPAGAAGVAGQQGGQHHAPTIVLSNSESLRAVQNSSAPGGGGNGSGGTTGPRMVPYVSYDGAYGQTQLVEAQPFLIYESDFQDEEDEPPPERKKTGLLQIPQAIERRLSQARLSFSVGSTPRMEPRASICFVPVGRTLSDPSTGNISFSAADIATPLPASLLIHSSVINPLVGAPVVDQAAIAVVDAAAAAASTPSDGAIEDAMIHSYCKTCGSCQQGSTAATASTLAAANVAVGQETREPTATSEPVVRVVRDDPDASDHQQSPTTIVVVSDATTTTLDRKDMPSIVVVENIDKPVDDSLTPNDACPNKSFPT